MSGSELNFLTILFLKHFAVLTEIKYWLTLNQNLREVLRRVIPLKCVNTEKSFQVFLIQAIPGNFRKYN